MLRPKAHASKNSYIYMSYGKPLFKEFIATFVIGVSHLSSGLFAFNSYIPTGKIFSPIGLLEFYTNIK